MRCILHIDKPTPPNYNLAMNKNQHQQGFGAVEVVLVLVIIGLVGFMGYYFISNNYKTEITPKNANVAKPATKPIPKNGMLVIQSSGPIILDSAHTNKSTTADWQTYKDSSFSFQYPSDWAYYKQGAQVSGQESADNQLVPKGEQLNGAAEFAFTVDNTDLSALDYLKKTPLATGEVINQKELKANGYTAATETQHGGGDVGGQNQDTNRAAVTHNEVVITFFYPTSNKYTSTYNQIFQTIKFSN
jgi:hypothetical protein